MTKLFGHVKLEHSRLSFEDVRRERPFVNVNAYRFGFLQEVAFVALTWLMAALEGAGISIIHFNILVR